MEKENKNSKSQWSIPEKGKKRCKEVPQRKARAYRLEGDRQNPIPEPFKQQSLGD